MIPSTIGIQRLNPGLRLAERNIKVVRSLTPWPRDTTQRISINSFGYGGANAHAILESTRMHENKEPGNPCNGTQDVYRSYLLPFSAQNSQSLARNIEAVIASGISPQVISDLAYTLGERRSTMAVRNFVLATQSNGQFQIDNPGIEAFPTPASPVPLAFVCTGQGAQWPRMGHELLTRFPIYRQTIQALDRCLADLPSPPSWTLEGNI